jgi:hypothetical protein
MKKGATGDGACEETPTESSAGALNSQAAVVSISSYRLRRSLFHLLARLERCPHCPLRVGTQWCPRCRP